MSMAWIDEQTQHTDVLQDRGWKSMLYITRSFPEGFIYLSVELQNYAVTY